MSWGKGGNLALQLCKSWCRCLVLFEWQRRGKLNAFEEYIVRKLTDKILSGDIPENLDALFDREVMNLRRMA